MERKRKIWRRRIAGIAAIIVIIVSAFAACGAGEEKEVIREDKRFNRYSGVEEYEVKSGDTLSGIALRYCLEDTDIREWIYDVEKLNGRNNSTIYYGETIKVFKCGKDD